MEKYFKNNSGYFLVWGFAIIPIIIWVFMMPVAQRFSSTMQTFRSLGQLAGLSGMTLLCLNFILSARFKFLDKWFNGLNRVYLKHHFIGGMAFSLLLFHPTFLTLQYLKASLSAAYAFLFAFDNSAVVFGEAAFLVFVTLMIITFYFNFKYHIWKNTHKFLGAVLFLGGLHMLMVPSDISANAFLKYYMILVATAGGASYLYRTIFSLYKRKEYKYRLAEVKKISENIAELKFKPLEEKMSHLPGQFVFARFEKNSKEAKENKFISESHPFSISSSSKGDLSLGIKILGDYTSAVYSMKPGAICNIEGPFGVFSYLKSKSKRQIWVAGGIGITPFLGMARQINADKNSGYSIDLYYSVKNQKEAAFADELSCIAKQNANFRFYPHFSEKDGFISANLISKKSANISGSEIFLCGPGSFMKSLREQFIKFGIQNDKIYSEEFSL